MNKITVKKKTNEKNKELRDLHTKIIVVTFKIP
jgi:hypothetical protein